jgi:leader peptidase (prepilin peptidase)/N-methyltransferase
MAIFIFILGLGLGWTANLLADRLPFHQGPSLPGCPACGARYDPLAWSGIAAFLFSMQDCSYCGRERALRWPLVELVFAVWSLFLLQVFPDPLEYLSALVLSFVFLILLITDIEHHLVPHAVTIPAILGMLVLGGLNPEKGWLKSSLGGVGGFLIVFGFYLLGALFTMVVSRMRGESVDEVAFGFGDVTLATLIGVAVGWPGVILAIFIGFMAGGIFSAVFIVVSKLRNAYVPFSTIPYGPFLILGGLLVYIGGRELFSSILLP